MSPEEALGISPCHLVRGFYVFCTLDTLDHFEKGLQLTREALNSIREGFGKKPHASLRALENLESIAKKIPQKTPSPCDASVNKSLPEQPPGEWTLESLREAALVCVKCPHLAATRTQVVFGVGNPKAELMFVGEAPGADEDAQGEPFVGRAGQLLTRIIETMGFTRQSIYIGNVLKCRPDMPHGSSGNRKPRPEEMATCLPWLREQIALIRPRVLVALGATAAEGLLGETRPMKELRGIWLEYEKIPTLVTYHPAYLLRNQSLKEKRKVWEDMLLVLEKLGHPISEKQRGYFLSTS